jgi:hypothetical protein
VVSPQAMQTRVVIVAPTYPKLGPIFQVRRWGLKVMCQLTGFG